MIKQHRALENPDMTHTHALIFVVAEIQRGRRGMIFVAPFCCFLKKYLGTPRFKKNKKMGKSINL